MGFLQATGKFFGFLIFTAFLAFAIILIGVTNLTTHDSIKQISSGILGNQFSNLSQNDLQALRYITLTQCGQSSEITYHVSQDFTIQLNCNDVRNSDASQLPQIMSGAMLDSVYYKKFGCNFSNLIECSQSPANTFQGAPIFFISNEGNQLYRTATTYSAVIALIGLGILFVSIETWVGRLQGLGWNLVFTAFPVIVLNKVQSLIPSTGSSDVNAAIKPAIDNFISSLTNMFIIVLVVGILCLVAGYGIAFYQKRGTKKKK
ncbi:MAG: hypothetical protein HYW22_02445 [Candidatus Aenigmarchaeota archaeon]|nr:hypothetical protein [Candidatus Aenigmarchaeota archaeon]